MKVAVTGSTGFLGQGLVKKLLSMGYQVNALVRSKSKDLDPLVNQVTGDVLNFDSLSKCFTDVDAVFHLAGVVGYSRAQRPLMEEINVLGTKNVVEAIKKVGRPRLIHMSSVVAVGASFTPNIMNEDDKFNLSKLNLGYFETKKFAEHIVLSAAKNGEISATAVNPSTIWGIGDFKKGSRGIQLKVAKGKFPFYPPGGVNVVGADNVIEATIAALEKGRNAERYILSGENLLIRDSFKFIAEAAGVPAPSFPLPKWLVLAIGKTGDALENIGRKGPINSENAWASVLYHWFDNSKAKSELGLKDTDARTAMSESVKWGKENGFI